MRNFETVTMSRLFLKQLYKHMQPRGVAREKAQRASFRSAKVNHILLLTVCGFGVWYLVQVMSLASMGYMIKDLERSLVEHKKQTERLQVSVIEAQSYGTLQQRIEHLGLVKSENVEYVSTPRPVASR